MIIAMVMENMLKKLGHIPVGIAYNEEDAVHMALDKKPDLIMMDIKLRKGDGIKAMKEIREEKNIPVVFLTGNSDDDLVQRASGLAPVDFLSKPILNSDLIAVLNKAFD